ncbi:endothelin-converting enzyme 2-like, partial [Asbolus verrucosus]
EPEVCQSSPCARTSQELLLNYIDIKADPCEDFYRFSCGNFLNNTNLGDRSSRTTRNIMEDEIQIQIKNMLEEAVDTVDDPAAFNLAKKFYRACMNESAVEAEGLERMKQIFEQMGGWPTLVGNNWRENEFDWKDAVYKLRRMGINFEFFLILSVQRNKADPNRYILSLGDPSSYNSSEVTDEIKTRFLDYMVDVAVLMGAQEKRARVEQKEVMQFLLKLAQISEEARAANGTRLYNPFSVSELQTEFPNVTWYEYINRILDPVTGINYDDDINVTDPLYIKKLLILLNNTKKRIIANFICWRTLEQLMKYLPKKILNRAYEYFEKINSTTTRMPRWNTCLNATKSRLSTVISAAYVKKYLDEDTRQRAVSMIRNIKYQFMENLSKLDWLDEKTKNMAREKLVSSVEDIPSYNNLIEENRFYDKVEILEDKLLTSVLNLDYVTTNIQYEKLRRLVNENFLENSGSVTGLNIVYSPRENSLQIPAGLFQGIFYQKKRPEYMNHGALGTVIAHEIYHIITEAEYKNSKGKLTSWWSSHSLLNYEHKLQCLSNRYGKFVISKIEQHLNSSNIRDEDMADLAGMKVAYDTYIAWVRENGVEPQLPGLNYSPNQLFWISSAIHHCSKHFVQTLQKYNANYQPSSDQFRVNGALQNLDEFAMDFGCPTGANMNPANKCRIW